MPPWPLHAKRLVRDKIFSVVTRVASLTDKGTQLILGWDFGKSEGFSFHFERKRSLHHSKRSVWSRCYCLPPQNWWKASDNFFLTLGPRNQWGIQAYSHSTARFMVGFHNQKARTGNLNLPGRQLMALNLFSLPLVNPGEDLGFSEVISRNNGNYSSNEIFSPDFNS